MSRAEDHRSHKTRFCRKDPSARARKNVTIRVREALDHVHIDLPQDLLLRQESHSDPKLEGSLQFKQLSKSILPSGFSVNECPLKSPLATGACSGGIVDRL